MTLEVSNIRDVEWNKDAYDMLVADKETKELVRALVENQCNKEKNTDLISGKGNGLFILLHGWVSSYTLSIQPISLDAEHRVQARLLQPRRMYHLEY